MKYILMFFLLLMPYRILIADDALSVHYPLVPLIPPLVATLKEPINSSLQVLTHKYADKYGVLYETMAKIIKCESGWNPNAHNPKGEDSWGLVQINLPAHKDITVDMAKDPNFALNFLAKELSTGNGHLWTCYNR